MDDQIVVSEQTAVVGKRVELHPTYASIELATLFNQVRKRHVPTSVLANDHFEFRQSIPQLYKKYGDRIKIVPRINKVWGDKRGAVAEFSDLGTYLEKEKLAKDIVEARIQKIMNHIKEFGVEKTKLRLPKLQNTAP